LENWAEVLPLALKGNNMSRYIFLLVFLNLSLEAADHRDASMITRDFKADINDVYAWVPPAPANDRLNLIMTVAPNVVYAGFNANDLFDETVRYSFNIDSNFNGSADRWIDCTFGLNSTSNQEMTVTIRGTSATVSSVVAGPDVDDARDLSTGDVGANDSTKRINSNAAGTLSAFAGLRDDPFYLDMPGYKSFVASFLTQTTGTKAGNVSAAYVSTLASSNVSHVDFFGRENIAAIALQVSFSSLGITTGDTIQLNGATYRKALRVKRAGLNDGVRGAWVQVDRLAKPSINIVFETANPVARHKTDPELFSHIDENSANRSDPTSDLVVFGPDYQAFIGALNLNGASNAAANFTTATWPAALTGVLLPDWIRVQTSHPCEFGTTKQAASDGIARTSQQSDLDLLNCYGQILAGDGSAGSAFMEYGRHLTDNVIDLSVTAVINPGLAVLGAPTASDRVVTDQIYSNDRTFLTTFPYLARPWAKGDL
jgi:hypothetical protein